MACFPSAEWLQSLQKKLNTDSRYAKVARNWEGDMLFEIDPGGALDEKKQYYLDLWHGECRRAFVVTEEQPVTPAFTLKATYPNYERLLRGGVDPMQALLTRKIMVQGNMAFLMRNVPTVLDFVRCCREITDSYI